MSKLIECWNLCPLCRLTLRITEKVLAKDGLPCRQFQRKTEPEQNAFSDF